MNNVKISPSMLACDFCNIESEIKCMENAGADMLHLDIMDGIFVPNISFGLPVISSMRKHTDLYFDTHLMIDRPERYIEQFVKAGSQNITFHVEACEDVDKTIEKIKSYGIAASISVKPKTPVTDIVKYLDCVDMVLVMTVEPGFGGQSFMADMMPKVEFLYNYRKEHGLSYLIEVDGGISDDTISVAAKAGADVFVAGSAVFKAKDRAKEISNLKQIANNI